MNGYVEAGYAIVLASLAGYALRLVRRRRLLERALPPVPAVTAPHPAADDSETTWP